MNDTLFASAFARACAAAGLATDEELRNRSMARLSARYREPGRYYHNVDHIAAMLQGQSLLDAPLATSPALTLAILYHDAVYDPRRHDNETESAELARADLATLGMPSGLIDRVAHLIRATQHGAGAITPGDDEAAFLLDLDLATLAGDPAAYRIYAADIRREYAHVPDALYRQGRTQVLEAFLARRAIFHTVEFRTRFEPRARENLRAEIAALASQ